MAEVENQRVSQRFRPQVEGFFRSQSLVQLFVKAVRGVEILPDFLAFGVGVTLVENCGASVSQFHGMHPRGRHCSERATGLPARLTGSAHTRQHDSPAGFTSAADRTTARRQRKRTRSTRVRSTRRE